MSAYDMLPEFLAWLVLLCVLIGIVVLRCEPWAPTDVERRHFEADK